MKSFDKEDVDDEILSWKSFVSEELFDYDENDLFSLPSIKSTKNLVLKDRNTIQYPDSEGMKSVTMAHEVKNSLPDDELKSISYILPLDTAFYYFLENKEDDSLVPAKDMDALNRTEIPSKTQESEELKSQIYELIEENRTIESNYRKQMEELNQLRQSIENRYIRDLNNVKASHEDKENIYLKRIQELSDQLEYNQNKSQEKEKELRNETEQLKLKVNQQMNEIEQKKLQLETTNSLLLQKIKVLETRLIMEEGERRREIEQQQIKLHDISCSFEQSNRQVSLLTSLLEKKEKEIIDLSQEQIELQYFLRKEKENTSKKDIQIQQQEQQLQVKQQIERRTQEIEKRTQENDRRTQENDRRTQENDRRKQEIESNSEHGLTNSSMTTTNEAPNFHQEMLPIPTIVDRSKIEKKYLSSYKSPSFNEVVEESVSDNTRKLNISTPEFLPNNYGRNNYSTSNSSTFKTPFATEKLLPKEQEQAMLTNQLERDLMHNHVEKEQLQAEYTKLEHTSVKTIKLRNRKNAIEERLRVLDKNIAQLKRNLRDISA